MRIHVIVLALTVIMATCARLSLHKCAHHTTIVTPTLFVLFCYTIEWSPSRYDPTAFILIALCTVHVCMFLLHIDGGVRMDTRDKDA